MNRINWHTRTNTLCFVIVKWQINTFSIQFSHYLFSICLRYVWIWNTFTICCPNNNLLHWNRGIKNHFSLNRTCFCAALISAENKTINHINFQRRSIEQTNFMTSINFYTLLAYPEQWIIYWKVFSHPG